MGIADKKPFVIGFDSEDDGEGHPFLWCFTTSEGIYYTAHREDACQWLANIPMNKGDSVQAEAWATNLEYDMCNLFDADHIAEVNLKFGRSALVGATWRKVNFRDTMRHIPIGVDAWGEFVGLEKKERRLFSDRNKPRTLRRYLVRCKRDSAITYRAASFLHERYKILGERPRMTLASTALNLWKNKYWRQGLRRPIPEIWNAALGAYHGGRTQVFHVGSFKDVHVIDVASMFPWAMTVAELPVPWGLYREARRGEHVVPWGLYRVQIDSNIERPCLPVRTDKGTIYPNGHWVAWYVGEELIQALEQGVNVHVLGGYVFSEMCKPFDEYVEDIFRRKNQSRGGPRLFYKYMGNTLYGKFRTAGKARGGNPIGGAFHDEKSTVRMAPLEWSSDIYSRGFAAPLGKQCVGGMDNGPRSRSIGARINHTNGARVSHSILRYGFRYVSRSDREVSGKSEKCRSIRNAWKLFRGINHREKRIRIANGTERMGRVARQGCSKRTTHDVFAAWSCNIRSPRAST